MLISIRHELSLTFPSGTGRALQHLLLTPRSGPTQTVKSWSIEMPGFDAASHFTDAYGNDAQLIALLKPEGEFGILVSGEVETIDRSGVVGRLPGDPVPALFKRVTPLTRSSPIVHGQFRNQTKDRIAVLHGLMSRVGELLRAEPEPAQMQTQGGQSQTQGTTKPPAAAQDYAHSFVGAARALDIPARYITGYLAAADDEPAAFHAWAEAWDDGLGWIGFDAMLDLCPTERHVRVAAGLDALSTVPVRSVPAMDEPVSIKVSAEAAQ